MQKAAMFYTMPGDEGLQLLEGHLACLAQGALTDKDLRQLEFWADCAETFGHWRGALRLFLYLAAYHAFRGELERCAYRVNDVGILLENAGDPRCIRIYHRALALTRDSRRRLRTLMRLGRAHFKIREDAALARRCLTGAVLIGWSLGERCTDTELAEAQLQVLLRGERRPPEPPGEEITKAAAMFELSQLPAFPA